MTALTALYEQGIKWVYENKKGKNVFAFLGSSISNLSEKERKEFLEYLTSHLKKGDMLLMGVDLKKDPEIMRMAYFQNRELADKFIWNMFVRINRELEGNFNLDNFFIYAYYDPYVGQIFHTVVSKCNQIVNVETRKLNWRNQKQFVHPDQRSGNEWNARLRNEIGEEFHRQKRLFCWSSVWEDMIS